VASFTLRFAQATDLRAAFDEHLSKRRAFITGATSADPRGACELVVESPSGATLAVAAEIVYVREEDPGRGVGLQLAAEAIDPLRGFVEAQAHAHEEDDDDARIAPLHERMRSLSNAEQQKIALTGNQPERVALERMYGPNVWEALLNSKRLTIPEVARIARKGTVPRPLVELIGGNTAWIAAPEVQRALLSNPRSSAAVVGKVLHAMSRSDLVKVPQQLVYPMSVRMAAKKLLGQL
jgi:hypothetical protein